MQAKNNEVLELLTTEIQWYVNNAKSQKNRSKRQFSVSFDCKTLTVEELFQICRYAPLREIEKYFRSTDDKKIILSKIPKRKLAQLAISYAENPNMDFFGGIDKLINNLDFDYYTFRSQLKIVVIRFLKYLDSKGKLSDTIKQAILT